MSQAGKEKKILVPNSVNTRLGEENSEKNSKKIQKIKKPLSDIIFSQDGMRQARKEKKILVPNSVQTRFGEENSQKNSKRIQKIKKNPFPALKKFQSRFPFILGLGKKIPKKIAKKFKKLKNPFLALFFAKTGLVRPRKRKKKFSPKFRSYSTRARKFRKKQEKNSTN